MRQKIYDIIEKSDGNNPWSGVYDSIMIIAILLSILPLAFKQDYQIFHIIDQITVKLFIFDYFLRLLTADYKMGQKGIDAFISYPFTFMAVVDLISILPSLTFVNNSFKLLRILRMLRAMRALTFLKVLRYSKSFTIIERVLNSSKDSLIAVCMLAAGYILVSALTVFSVEPDSFDTFFDAIYWATISLTTVGYGDIYPVTTIGRIVTMVSSIFGIAIVALPAGIITAGYMNELNNPVEDEEEQPASEKRRDRYDPYGHYGKYDMYDEYGRYNGYDR